MALPGRRLTDLATRCRCILRLWHARSPRCEDRESNGTSAGPEGIIGTEPRWPVVTAGLRPLAPYLVYLGGPELGLAKEGSIRVHQGLRGLKARVEPAHVAARFKYSVSKADSKT